MMIPKDVLLECAREFDIPGAKSLIERRAIHAGSEADHEVIDRIFAIVSNPAALRLQSVARWRSYLTSMHFKFYEVWNHLRRARKERLSPAVQTGAGGEVYVSTDPYVALPLAASLYHLDSWGVPGDVIECGSFKGVSSAMLSWSCKFLGRRLFTADSFCGLPAVTDANETYFKAGDYSGSLEEVKRTIRTFGCEDVVTYVPGFFEESLPFLKERFSMIWADVDLKLSMESVLEWLMPKLNDGGAFFSDEVPAASFNGPILAADVVSVPSAIREYATKHDIAMPGRHLKHNVSAFAPRATGELFLTYDGLQALLLQGASRPMAQRKVA